MFPILQIGLLAIQVPGLALLIGVWLGLSLTEKESARLQMDAEAVYRLAFVGLISGLIGARLAYAARYLSSYAADPLGLFSLNAATLAPGEGMLIGLAAAVIYGARHKLRLRTTLDALAPAFAVMAVAVALAHLSSGDAFGAAARLPWSIYLWDEYRHPSQVYELIAALGVLGVWWRQRGRSPFGGFSSLLVVALSAAARVFLEAFRGDSLVIAGGWRAAQVGGIAVLAVCLGLMNRWNQEVTP
ncbi:MAG: prolipoprotein diacylglyceryl transferase [Chloroflexi bacterium]|nr:prolipoprotein diacylglyceryl transferase [Chloroflexota bacterium]